MPADDLEQLQREPLARFGERTRGRRQSFALGERLLERGEPLARQANTRVEVLALAHRGARGASASSATRPSSAGGWATRRALRLAELERSSASSRCDRLVPDAEALGGAAQREQRVAAAAGEQRLGLRRAARAPRRARRRASGLRLPLDRGDARPALLRLDLQPRPLACRRLGRGGRFSGRSSSSADARRVVGPRGCEVGAERPT